MRSVSNFLTYICQRFRLPPHRVGHRIAEHVQKYGAEEVVGELDGLLAFAADGVGLVEDGGDALLFGQGWEGDFYCFKLAFSNVLKANPAMSLVNNQVQLRVYCISKIVFVDMTFININPKNVLI